MCNSQPEVGQYDLVALTKQEQRLLKAAPALIEACRIAYCTIKTLSCNVESVSAYNQVVTWRLATIQHAIDEATHV